MEAEAEAEESESDDEDMPELEEADKDASGAQVNRSEKKARKAILKLGLKQVDTQSAREEITMLARLLDGLGPCGLLV